MIVKKILVIDFTYIMNNVIRTYADRVNLSENSTIQWRKLKEYYGFDTDIVKYDAGSYKKIMALVAKAAALRSNYTTTVDMAIKVKELVRDKDYNYDITNIDFFDDVNFCQPNSSKFNDLNWIKYLRNKNRVEKYTWINCYNSSRDYNNTDIDEVLRLDNIDDIDLRSYDEIIFTFSQLFVPYEYKPLFDIIPIILDNVQNTLDNTYYQSIYNTEGE